MLTSVYRIYKGVGWDLINKKTIYWKDDERMVRVCGDLHGDQNKLAGIIRNNNLSKDDVLIVLGDFGFVFRNTIAEERFLADFTQSFDFTLAFISGNHENHPVINSFPVEERWGGNVNRLTDRVFHLINGEVYDFGDGITCFVMGGAYSIDKGLRSATKWLRLNFIHREENIELESSEDENFTVDTEGIVTVTSREECYAIIDLIYQTLSPVVEKHMPKYFAEYRDLRYSNADEKKLRQSKRIEDIILEASSAKYQAAKCAINTELKDCFKTHGYGDGVIRLKLDEGSWWREELPTQEDYRNATANLKRVNMKVRYILSHTLPREIIYRYGRYPEARDMELTGFLEWVMYECDFDMHYCGHWHDDVRIGDKHTIVFNEVHKL